jgi:uncharacterized membrane protein YbhN (UPF0104 family)
VGELAIRIGVVVVTIVIACAGLSASFGFLCFAIYAWLSTFMPAAPAAVVTALAVLLGTALIVAAAIAWLSARSRRRVEKGPFAFGKALGEMFGERYRSYMAEKPNASLLVSLVAGFMSGADR